MRNWFTFAGVDSRDFGVYISGQGTFGAPEKAYEFMNIPGRNGAVIGPERRLENATLTYECFIYRDFEKNIADFRTFLLSTTGYQRLTDTYHTDEFRMAVYTGPFEPEVNSKNDVGSFTLTFSCKPQRFLLTGESRLEFDENGTHLIGTELDIQNPAYLGTGSAKVYVSPAGKEFDGFNNNSFSLHGTVDNPMQLPEGVDWVELGYPNVPQALYYGNLAVTNLFFPLRVFQGTVELVGGSASADAFCFTPSGWGYDGNHIFSCLHGLNTAGRIKACTHYEPVYSYGSLTGDTGKIFFEQYSVYVYDPRFTSLAQFESWYSTAGFQAIVKLTTARSYSVSSFSPSYPADPFTLVFDPITNNDPRIEAALSVPYASSVEGMTNPTMFPSQPMIRVYGEGNVEVNGITISVLDCTSYVDIDCDMMDCYEGSTNRNNDVTFSTYDFPVLSPGENPVVVDGPTRVLIQPRWWRV